MGKSAEAEAVAGGNWLYKIVSHVCGWLNLKTHQNFSDISTLFQSFWETSMTLNFTQ